LSRAQHDKIARLMLYEYADHGQPIRRSEARANGLSFIADLERTPVEPEVNELFNLYADVLKLRSPFARASLTLDEVVQTGDESDFDVGGMHISETPIAIVESEFDTNPAYVGYDLRHWNGVPPMPPAEEDIVDKTPATAKPAKPGTKPVAFWVSDRKTAPVSPSVVKIFKR
jgi:hypothetical protein